VGLPGYWELLWMLFMQPVTLHRRLKACGIGKPDGLIWRLWWAPEPQRTICRAYVRRMVLILSTITPLSAVLVAVSASRIGMPCNIAFVAVSAVSSVVLGIVAGAARGVARGVAVGITLGALGGLSNPFASAATFELFLVTFGMFAGVSAGVPGRVANGVVSSVTARAANGVALAMVFGALAGVLRGVSTSSGDAVGMGISVGLAIGVPLIISVFRLHLYPIEVLGSACLWTSERFFSIPTLHLTPVLHHDLSYVPHPFLLRHILLGADRSPELANRVLEACTIAPGQRRIGQAALVQLQARELKASARNRRFARIVNLRADQTLDRGASAHSWLPGVEGAAPALLAFRNIARYLAAAANATVPHHRLKHLRGANQALMALQNQLIADDSVLGRSLLPILPTWKKITRAMRKKARSDATGSVPNPFRPADSLDPEMGQEVFRGRSKDIKQIELLLADPTQSGSIALLAPRRVGKSSLLKMLPALLPDAVCIFFDLQDHPVDSPAGFFRALHKSAVEQARRDHQLALPPFPEGSPFEAGSDWFRALDALAEDRRILICIDEFERLETLFPGDKSDLLKLMGLFRATIQHRKKLRLLVSGAAPFDELGDLWNDHFINVQEVHLDLLDKSTSLDLLTCPIPEFPADAVPLEIAEAIYTRTGGQPFLLQAYGSALISRINEGDRKPRAATMEDLPFVEETVLSRWKPYFADTFKSAPPDAREALHALAAGKQAAISTKTRRWLERRCLLTRDDQLRIPVLGAWIRTELDD
jgi:hypothetical protein